MTRSRTASARRLALTAAAGSALLLMACGGNRSPVAVTSVPTGACQAATDDKDWADMGLSPVAFGLDYLKVSDPVEVTSARLVGVQGGLRLARVAFVAGGGVGGGAKFDSGHPAAVQSTWEHRVSLPDAALDARSGTAVDRTRLPRGQAWQLVVGVVSTGDAGWAKGVELTYRSGDSTWTIVGQDGVGLSREPGGCEQLAGVP